MLTTLVINDLSQLRQLCRLTTVTCAIKLWPAFLLYHSLIVPALAFPQRLPCLPYTQVVSR